MQIAPQERYHVSRIQALQHPVGYIVEEDGADGRGVRDEEALLGLLTAVVACFGRGGEDVVGACVGGCGGVEGGIGGEVADEVEDREGTVEGGSGGGGGG